MNEKSEHVIRQEHFVSGHETGVESERERIIKLLDSHFVTCQKMTYECEVCSDRIELIALIKGESK